MNILKIVSFSFLVVMQGIPSHAEEDGDTEKLYQILCKPIVLEGFMLPNASPKIITVAYGNDFRYYCRVDLEIFDFGVYREHIKKLKITGVYFGNLQYGLRITVLCPASKTTKNGVEKFEPLSYGKRNDRRKYLLIYCPGIEVDNTLPFLIASDEKPK